MKDTMVVLVIRHGDAIGRRRRRFKVIARFEAALMNFTHRNRPNFHAYAEDFSYPKGS
jgi:hypothetical protein